MTKKDYQIFRKQFIIFLYNYFCGYLKNIFILHFKLRFGLVKTINPYLKIEILWGDILALKAYQLNLPYQIYVKLIFHQKSL